MKLFNKNISAFLLTVIIFMSCEKIKDFGDTNVNPNSTTTPNTAALLTNVLAGIAGQASQQNPGYYCQYFSETQYPTISLYSLPKFDMDGTYAGPLFDCQNIINTCKDPSTSAQAAANGSLANQIAIATILKSYYFWTVTDSWGDIPYADALTVTNIFPKFDKQEAVYKGLIAELTAIVEQFESTGAVVRGDIAYSGDTGKWKKLANSLRVLMALRLSKKYPGATDYAAQQFQLALAHPAGIIEDNADNFKITYPGGAFRNPWFVLYDARDDVGESLQFVQLLNTLGDKRQLNKIFGSSDNGVPYGRDRASFMNAWFAANSTTYSKVLGSSYRQANSPVVIVHAAAVIFAKAEAREIGWITESTASQLYTDGITASYTQWGIPATDVNSYLTNTDVRYGTDNLKKIALQRYIALYPDGLQGWSEWRRTGVPALTPAQNAGNITKVIPRRFVYGVNDYSTNKINVTDAAAAIPVPAPTPAGAVAGDTQDGRVWWDQ